MPTGHRPRENPGQHNLCVRWHIRLDVRKSLQLFKIKGRNLGRDTPPNARGSYSLREQLYHLQRSTLSDGSALHKRQPYMLPSRYRRMRTSLWSGTLSTGWIEWNSDRRGPVRDFIIETGTPPEFAGPISTFSSTIHQREPESIRSQGDSETTDRTIWSPQKASLLVAASGQHRIWTTTIFSNRWEYR